MQHYAAEECRCFWGGVLASLHDAIWFNHLDSHRRIDRKIQQLNLARADQGLDADSITHPDVMRWKVAFLPQPLTSASSANSTGMSWTWS